MDLTPSAASRQHAATGPLGQRAMSPQPSPRTLPLSPPDRRPPVDRVTPQTPSRRFRADRLAGVLGALLGLASAGIPLDATCAETPAAGARAIARQAGSPPAPPQPLYETRTDHDPDGTGRFFLGREIAQVMGHQGADWLERPERIDEEHPDQAVQALRLRPGDVVADIGAGSGYFSRRLAQAVGPAGRVLAVDIQPEMLTRLGREMADRGITNVTPVLGTVTDPKLPPRSVDLVLMVDVYHEFSHPYEMLEGIVRALRPGGRVAFVEYRAEDPQVPIKRVHKMTEAQVRKEAELHALEWIQTDRSLPWQHLILFRLAEASPPAPPAPPTPPTPSPPAPAR